MYIYIYIYRERERNMTKDTLIIMTSIMITMMRRGGSWRWSADHINWMGTHQETPFKQRHVMYIYIYIYMIMITKEKTMIYIYIYIKK